MKSRRWQNLQNLTNYLLHVSPHAIKGSCTARDIVDVVLKGTQTPGLRCLTVLSPKVDNVFLHTKRGALNGEVLTYA